MSAASYGSHSSSRSTCRAMSGAGASTSGRCFLSPTAPAGCPPSHKHLHMYSGYVSQAQKRVPAGQSLSKGFANHKQNPKRQLASCAQQTERPMMEQMESDLITSTDSSQGQSNGSKAPRSNSATNVADRPKNGASQQGGSAPENGSQCNGSGQNGSSEPNVSEEAKAGDRSEAETSQDEEHSNAGAQTKNSAVKGKEKATARVPGGVSDADSDSMPKPASFWLPHPEPEDFREKRPDGGIELTLKQVDDARNVMMTAPRTASSFIKRRVQQLMLSNTAVKISALTAVTLPAVLIGGEIYSAITGQPASLGFIKIYSVLLMIPGVNLLTESNMIAGILLNAMFLLGTFTFAVVLGVVSDDISSEVKAIRSGNYPVMDKDHILVLNWNRQTIPLLRQLALATNQKAEEAQKFSVKRKHQLRESKGRFLADKTVVIMAERSKTEMDQQVQAALKGYKIRWQTREGAPYSASDLAKVSASQASTVILMRPDNSRVQYKDDDSPAVRRKRLHQIIAQREVAALLGINAGRGPKAKDRRQQNVIVQAPEDGTDVVTAAKRVLTEPGLNTLGLKDRRDITRLVAQSALQPGVASVHASILQKSSESASFHLRDMPKLHGLSFGDIRRKFSTAIVCGYYCGDNRSPHLNPKDSYKYRQEDKLIFLANKDDFTPSTQGLAGEFDRFLKDGYSSIRDGVPDVEPPTKNIVVMGWCGDIQDLVDSLTLFTPGKTIVNVLCNCCPENWPDEQDGSTVEFRYMCGDVDHSGALVEAGVTEADAIIIGPADDLPDNEADASMLSSLIMIQDLLIEAQRPRSRPVHVVAVVRSPQSVKVANYMVRDLAQGTMTAELLQPDELVSGLMAQVTSEPGLAPLLSELIHSTEGQEVRLREPADYHIHDLKKTSFAEVAEYARTKSETAIGYVTMQGELFLAPEAGHKHVYRNTDHVVVIAKE